MSASATIEVIRQHLIDPEICIRCNTCEETCPVDAVTHDARNYVVDVAKCNGCNECISPCPTGAIDNWRQVERKAAYTLADQLSWDSPSAAAGDRRRPSRPSCRPTCRGSPRSPRRDRAARRHRRGRPAHPYVNLYTIEKPAIATVSGNYRLTGDDASSDIRHIVLDFGGTSFPVLEGQTIGIVPPGHDAAGRPHFVRLYSVASPRDGRATALQQSRPDGEARDRGSRRQARDRRRVELLVRSRERSEVSVGRPLRHDLPHAQPSGFDAADGVHGHRLGADARDDGAPATSHREKEGGELMLFFGARTPDELPYFGPLLKLPKEFIDINFAFSRVAGEP
jgi:benzoyl-CoA 2,3-dioxygenase component A